MALPGEPSSGVTHRSGGAAFVVSLDEPRGASRSANDGNCHSTSSNRGVESTGLSWTVDMGGGTGQRGGAGGGRKGKRRLAPLERASPADASSRHGSPGTTPGEKPWRRGKRASGSSPGRSSPTVADPQHSAVSTAADSRLSGGPAARPHSQPGGEADAPSSMPAARGGAGAASSARANGVIVIPAGGDDALNGQMEAPHDKPWRQHKARASPAMRAEPVVARVEAVPAPSEPKPAAAVDDGAQQVKAGEPHGKKSPEADMKPAEEPQPEPSGRHKARRQASRSVTQAAAACNVELQFTEPSTFPAAATHPVDAIDSVPVASGTGASELFALAGNVLRWRNEQAKPTADLRQQTGSVKSKGSLSWLSGNDIWGPVRVAHQHRVRRHREFLKVFSFWRLGGAKESSQSPQWVAAFTATPPPKSVLSTAHTTATPGDGQRLRSDVSVTIPVVNAPFVWHMRTHQVMRLHSEAHVSEADARRLGCLRVVALHNLNHLLVAATDSDYVLVWDVRYPGEHGRHCTLLARSTGESASGAFAGSLGAQRQPASDAASWTDASSDSMSSISMEDDDDLMASTSGGDFSDAPAATSATPLAAAPWGLYAGHRHCVLLWLTQTIDAALQRSGGAMDEAAVSAVAPDAMAAAFDLTDSAAPEEGGDDEDYHAARSLHASVDSLSFCWARRVLVAGVTLRGRLPAASPSRLSASTRRVYEVSLATTTSTIAKWLFRETVVRGRRAHQSRVLLAEPGVLDSGAAAAAVHVCASDGAVYAVVDDRLWWFPAPLSEGGDESSLGKAHGPASFAAFMRNARGRRLNITPSHLRHGAGLIIARGAAVVSVVLTEGFVHHQPSIVPLRAARGDRVVVAHWRDKRAVLGSTHGMLTMCDPGTGGEALEKRSVTVFEMLPEFFDYLFLVTLFASLPLAAQFPWSAPVDPLRVSIPLLSLELNFSVYVYIALFAVASGLVISAAALARVFHRRQLRRRQTARGGGEAPKGRVDSVAWVVVWACSTVLFVPLTRVLVGVAGCTDHGDGTLTWVRDTTSSLQYPNELGTSSPSGDFPCFGPVHLALSCVAAVALPVLFVVAFRLAPVAGDMELIERWRAPIHEVMLLQNAPYRGPFTASAHKPIVDMTDVSARLVVAIVLTVASEDSIFRAVAYAALSGCVALAALRYPPYAAPRVNAILAGANLVGFITCACGVATVLIDDPENVVTGIIVDVVWACALVVLLVVIAQEWRRAGKRREEHRATISSSRKMSISATATISASLSLREPLPEATVGDTGKKPRKKAASPVKTRLQKRRFRRASVEDRKRAAAVAAAAARSAAVAPDNVEGTSTRSGSTAWVIRDSPDLERGAGAGAAAPASTPPRRTQVASPKAAVKRAKATIRMAIRAFSSTNDEAREDVPLQEGTAVDAPTMQFPTFDAWLPRQALSDFGESVHERNVVSLAEMGDVSSLGTLLDAGADVNERVGGTYALVAACKWGLRDVAQFLLARGADVLQRDKAGWTPLGAAIDSANEELAIDVLNRVGDDELALQGTPGMSLLMMAASAGLIAVVRALLARGVDVDELDSRRRTALMRAAGEGHADVVHLLVDSGANVALEDRTGTSALGHAAAGGHVRTVDKLLSLRAAVERRRGPTFRSNMRPLRLAAEKGHDAAVMRLLDAKAELDGLSTDGCTALMAACSGGHISTITLLLERGASVNAGSGDSALLRAVRGGHSSIARMLVGRGADVNFVSSKSLGTETPLGAAVHSGDHHLVVELLRADPPADPNVRCTEASLTPLLRACSHNAHHAEAIVQELLSAGADLEATDKRGRTPLIIAVAHGHDAIVRLLLASGVDVNARPENKRTALYHAVRRHDPDLVELLLQHGADRSVKVVLRRPRRREDLPVVHDLLWIAQRIKQAEAREAIIALLTNKRGVAHKGDA